jgi:hypothetical protein
MPSKLVIPILGDVRVHKNIVCLLNSLILMLCIVHFVMPVVNVVVFLSNNYSLIAAFLFVCLCVC